MPSSAIRGESVLYQRTADGADMADSSYGTSVTVVIESGTVVPTKPTPPTQGHLPRTGGLLDLTLLLAVLLVLGSAVLLRTLRALPLAGTPTPRMSYRRNP